MTRTTVKVYLRSADWRDKDDFVTTINLPSREARDYYFGKWFNMGTDTDRMMMCYKVEVLSSMREIKFRGLTLDGVKWVYGDLRQENSGMVAIKTNLNTWRDNDGQCDSYGENFYVKPETVGQYTGMKDKKGKEVYEGDIVYVTDVYDSDIEDGDYIIGKRHMITFSLSCFCLKWNHDIYCLSAFELEVIGNIHDNPELLKGGEE